MGRLVNPPEGYTHWVASSGYLSTDFKEQGTGPCHLHRNIEEEDLTWFQSERLANGHPAVMAFKLVAEIDSNLAGLEKLKSEQAYSAKQFDAFRWRQAYPTQELSDAADFDAELYKDMAVDIDVEGITPWEASERILTAIEKLRVIETNRKTLKKKLKESIPNEQN